MVTFNFETFIRKIEAMGFLDVVLPFLLFFTIMFAALQRTKVLGDKDSSDPSGKKYNIVVSLVIASLAVIPHVIGGQGHSDGRMIVAGRNLPDPVQIINNSLPSVAIWVVGILMFMLILGIFGFQFGVFGVPLASWVAGFAVLLIGFIFGSAAGWWGTNQTNNFIRALGLNNPNNQFGLLLILAFALVVWFVISDDTGINWDNYKTEFNKFSQGNSSSGTPPASGGSTSGGSTPP
jgi:hypothetical protein